jgi:hypothetical protein
VVGFGRVEQSHDELMAELIRSLQDPKMGDLLRNVTEQIGAVEAQTAKLEGQVEAGNITSVRGPTSSCTPRHPRLPRHLHPTERWRGSLLPSPPQSLRLKTTAGFLGRGRRTRRRLWSITSPRWRSWPRR